jgi:protein-disulfide isomerase
VSDQSLNAGNRHAGPAVREEVAMSVPQVAQTRRERRLAARLAHRDARPNPRPAGRRLGLGALTVIGLLGGLAIVALAIVLGARPTPIAADAAVVKIARAPAGVAAEGFVLGRADAPVTIDLYEDFQCPACEAWGQNVFPMLAGNELAAGTARVVFHDMAFLGPESTDAGRAAYAASRQGRFWDMWATLYANQGHENSGAFSRIRLIAMAEQLGLDVTSFVADMDSSSALAAIEASRKEAGRAGVSSTPTLVIDGHQVGSAQAYADVAAAISAAVR